ncbi:hypothetical protein J6590_082290 [Homalodisca vitripennis]|nr:hypothetical protein J6590_082290 [Homalodisca vitripennis]
MPQRPRPDLDCWPAHEGADSATSAVLLLVHIRVKGSSNAETVEYLGNTTVFQYPSVFSGYCHVHNEFSVVIEWGRLDTKDI